MMNIQSKLMRCPQIQMLTLKIATSQFSVHPKMADQALAKRAMHYPEAHSLMMLDKGIYQIQLLRKH